MREQQDIITAFSEMAPRYESLMNMELDRFWGLSYEEFIMIFLKNFGANSEELVLDIATGTGFIPSYLVKNGKQAKGIIGLDLTFKMLENAKKRLESDPDVNQTSFICASAHDIPFKAQEFERVICCLATHHMNVEKLSSNMYQVLKSRGKLHIADAGGSSRWKNWLMRIVIKTGAFLYFLIAENYARAVAESSSIANILTDYEWKTLLENCGFREIHIRLIKSKKIWAPDPIIIEATK